MKKITGIKTKASKLLIATSSIFLALAGVSHGEDIAYFEKKYGEKIEGVKPMSEYSDPDSYYTDIARQLGIFDIAYAAVSEKYGWKKNGNMDYSAKLTRGDGGPWEVVVVRVNVDPETMKPDCSKMHSLEMKLVFIGDDGNFFFPDPQPFPERQKGNDNVAQDN